nr:exocyst complex component 3-like protein 4 isoform X1 [Pogona vitticeps]XP_020649219.1 exocyst complex component 3-like protein 4 isoform X1 [Pogona vitticeps]
MDECKTERREETSGETELPSVPKSPSKCSEGKDSSIALNFRPINNQGETRLKTFTRDFKSRWSFKDTRKSVKEDSTRVKMDESNKETRKANAKTEFPGKCIEGEGDKDSPPVDDQEENLPQPFSRVHKIMQSFRNGSSLKEKSFEETGASKTSSKRFSLALVFKWQEDGDQATKEKESMPEENQTFGREECVQKEPLSVMQINELIQKRQLLEAFEHIRDLEIELLAEREAKKYEDNLKNYMARAKDVDLLYKNLSKEIQDIVEQMLDRSSMDAKVLIEKMVALIEEEEKSHSGATNITVPSEPVDRLGLARNWRELWEKMVSESVTKRIHKVHIPLKDDPSWLLTHLGFLKNVVRQDLLTIKDSIHKFYPDDYRAYDIYLKAFHEALSLHLQGILEEQDSFESQEFHAVLHWVTKVYHSEEFLGHPDLQPELKTEDLPSLLTPEVLDKLKKDYIHSVKRKTKSCLENIQILEAKEKWDSEEQPEALQSQYNSSLSFDIQTIVGEHMKASGKICKNLEMAVLEMSVKEVTEFIPCFGKAFLEQDKVKDYPQFASLMVAYLNNFHDLRMDFRTRFNVSCEELEKNLDELILRYRKYFLNKLMLKTQLMFKKILSKAWIINSRTLDSFIMKILGVIEDFSQHLKNLKEPICKEFLNEVHKFVVKEYIRQILKPKAGMKRTKRELISRIMTEEAATINDTMKHLGSNADWLFLAIPHIATIMSEKEKGKIKCYLEQLAWNYPDISEEHMMAILTLRGLSKKKRQSIARHVNRPSDELESGSGRTLFAEIELPNTIQCF